MKYLSELAEFIGIMLGDGNLYKPKTRGIYYIRVTNHSIDDKEYRDHIKKLFFLLFKKEMKCYKYEPNATVLVCYNKLIFEFIEKYGFQRGKKRVIM